MNCRTPPTGRPSAPTESQKKELVSRVKSSHEKTISVQDFFLQAPAKCAAEKPVEATGTDAFVIEHQLLDTVTIDRRDAARDFGDIAGAHSSVVYLIWAVP